MYFDHKPNSDARYRLYFNLVEKKTCLFRYLIFSNKKKTKNIAYFFFIKNIKNTYVSKIKNRCIYSGNSRSVISRFKVSRHVFKKLANSSMLGSVKKK